MHNDYDMDIWYPGKSHYDNYGNSYFISKDIV